MNKLNEHILFVMKWKDDPSQFTQEQIKENYDAASAAAIYWVNKYFERSGEHKQNYLDKIEADKMENEESVYTQAMFDACEVPKVGMNVELKFNTPSKREKGELLALTKEYAILRVGETMEQHFHLSSWSFVACDTRTDKQKLADQIDEYVIDKNINAIDTEKFINAIINGEFENLEYTGEK